MESVLQNIDDRGRWNDYILSCQSSGVCDEELSSVIAHAMLTQNFQHLYSLLQSVKSARRVFKELCWKGLDAEHVSKGLYAYLLQQQETDLAFTLAVGARTWNEALVLYNDSSLPRSSRKHAIQILIKHQDWNTLWTLFSHATFSAQDTTRVFLTLLRQQQFDVTFELFQQGLAVPLRYIKFAMRMCFAGGRQDVALRFLRACHQTQDKVSILWKCFLCECVQAGLRVEISAQQIDLMNTSPLMYFRHSEESNTDVYVVAIQMAAFQIDLGANIITIEMDDLLTQSSDTTWIDIIKLVLRKATRSSNKNCIQNICGHFTSNDNIMRCAFKHAMTHGLSDVVQSIINSQTGNIHRKLMEMAVEMAVKTKQWDFISSAIEHTQSLQNLHNVDSGSPKKEELGVEELWEQEDDDADKEEERDRTVIQSLEWLDYLMRGLSFLRSPNVWPPLVQIIDTMLQDSPDLIKDMSLYYVYMSASLKFRHHSELCMWCADNSFHHLGLFLALNSERNRNKLIVKCLHKMDEHNAQLPDALNEVVFKSLVDDYSCTNSTWKLMKNWKVIIATVERKLQTMVKDRDELDILDYTLNSLKCSLDQQKLSQLESWCFDNGFPISGLWFASLSSSSNNWQKIEEVMRTLDNPVWISLFKPVFFAAVNSGAFNAAMACLKQAPDISSLKFYDLYSLHGDWVNPLIAMCREEGMKDWVVTLAAVSDQWETVTAEMTESESVSSSVRDCILRMAAEAEAWGCAAAQADAWGCVAGILPKCTGEEPGLHGLLYSAVRSGKYECAEKLLNLVDISSSSCNARSLLADAVCNPTMLTVCIQAGITTLQLQQATGLYSSPLRSAVCRSSSLSPALIKAVLESGACSLEELRSLAVTPASFSWFSLDSYPVEVVQFASEASSRPRSLQSLCRLQVSNLLGCGSARRLERINSLPVPQLIKDYLMFCDIERDLELVKANPSV